MKRYIVLIFTLSLFGSLTVLSQEQHTLDSIAALLFSEMQNKNYEQAKHYVNEVIRRNEPINSSTLLDCAEYYYQTNDYEGCISFCENWTANHENDNGFVPQLFYTLCGECYRMLGNYKKAVEYMDKYVDYLNGNLAGIIPADLYTYANSLHKNYQHNKADSIYIVLINRMLSDEGITAEGIKDHPNKNLFGTVFYEWAYNRIYQGDEKLGLKLLQELWQN